jgi:hypothetical protein
LWLAALLTLLVLGDACVLPAASPPPTLALLIESYEREVAPNYPFTASERGARRYDRVLEMLDDREESDSQRGRWAIFGSPRRDGSLVAWYP